MDNDSSSNHSRDYEDKDDFDYYISESSVDEIEHITSKELTEIFKEILTEKVINNLIKEIISDFIYNGTN